jgi:hypothetical protein
MFAAGCASEAEIKARQLLYQNREFGFSINFPANWQSYRVFDSKEYLAADLRVRVLHVCLPTRSQDWQWSRVPSPYAAVFTIFVFNQDSWKLYSEKYAAAGAVDTILGRSDKYVFIMRYPSGLPVDLNQYMKEIALVASQFKLLH